MKQQQKQKRWLAGLLAVALAVTLFPISATAVEGEVTFVAVDGTAGNANESYSNVVDGKNSGSGATKWCVQKHTSGTFVVIKAVEGAITLSGYTLITGNDTYSYSGRNPKAWTLSGSNDYNETNKTGTWTTISTVTDGEMPKANYVPKAFSVSGAAAYQYYKFNVTEIASTDGNTLFQLCGITFTYTMGGTSGGGTTGGTDVIDVNLSWRSMDFTYVRGSWDPQTHSYGAAQWKCFDGTQEVPSCVTFRNDGESAVEVGVAFASAVSGVACTWESTLFKLEAESSKTGSFSLTGAPSTELNDAPLGTITVTLKKWTDDWSYSCAGVSDADFATAFSNTLAAGKTDITLNNVDQTKLTAAVNLLKTSSLSADSIALTVNGVTRLSDNAFSGCTALKALSLPDVTTVDASAFEGCSALTSLSLPNAISIADYVFQGCSSLVDLKLMAHGMIMLGWHTFDGVTTTNIDLSMHKNHSSGDLPYANRAGDDVSLRFDGEEVFFNRIVLYDDDHTTVLMEI